MIVVGGGIAGCTVALALRERGSQVTLVRAPDLVGTATDASAGMVVPQYETAPSDPTFRLGVESHARYPGFLADVSARSGSDVSLEGGGMLVANQTPSEHEAASRAARAHRAEGLESEVLDAADARKLAPVVDPETRSFLWFPAAARLDCRRLATALWRAVDAAGVRLISGKAVGLLSAAGRAHGVRLEDGQTVRDAGVVVAAGCWSGELADLPRRLPVRPIRGQMLRLESDRLPRGPVLADHAGRYLIPRRGGAVAGSTMDEAGFESEVTAAGRASIRRAAGRLCPAAAHAAIVEEWAGLRPVSDDGMPIIGPDPDEERLFYATGYGRSGILLAPRLAEMVADLALGREPDAGWKALSISRWGTGAPRTSASGHLPPRR